MAAKLKWGDAATTARVAASRSLSTGSNYAGYGEAV
jgi:hypothetical protein